MVDSKLIVDNPIGLTHLPFLFILYPMRIDDHPLAN